jgi:hypothetical protein
MKQNLKNPVRFIFFYTEVNNGELPGGSGSASLKRKNGFYTSSDLVDAYSKAAQCRHVGKNRISPCKQPLKIIHITAPVIRFTLEKSTAPFVNRIMPQLSDRKYLPFDRFF